RGYAASARRPPCPSGLSSCRPPARRRQGRWPTARPPPPPGGHVLRTIACHDDPCASSRQLRRLHSRSHAREGFHERDEVGLSCALRPRGRIGPLEGRNRL